MKTTSADAPAAWRRPTTNWVGTGGRLQMQLPPVIAPLIRETGWHLLGTCKMGTDPATSVVDAWGKTHDIPNLYIFDGSIWPTSSGMNPTATIAAMALRCADHLVQQGKHQEVPA